MDTEVMRHLGNRYRCWYTMLYAFGATELYTYEWLK